ncbi:MAG: hypothetical protein KAU95_03675, partial [Candidatus Aenigmarchaeota archaeon]|nr:hypothetical protein [Candidatus Aenigmarchaeota archaeon]
MKGQWYIVTAVLFSFSLLTFFNVFECYSGVDFTSVIENDEDLVALNLMENLNLTIENSEYMENVGADIGDLFEMFERNLVGRGYFFDYNYTTDGGINITKLTIRGTNLKISYILPVCGNGILDFGEECENLTDCSISDFPYRNCTRNRECANCECEGYLDCSGSTCFKGSPDYCAYCDHCEDGTQNCDEDGVDCGGSKCSPCTTQNCTPGTCNTTTRKYCLPDGNWSIQDSTEYCNNCDHCGDGVWNCDESGVDCGGNDCLSCSTQNCTLQGGTCCTGGQTCNGIILMASDCYSPDICCDGTCESLTSCTPETCNTTTRRYCLSGGNWSAQDSTEYCTNCTHCPDGSCNCEENCSTCSSDCGSCSSLPGWDYRKPITLTENSGNSLIDYQVKINVTYDFDMQPDFDDLRFTNFDGTKN